MTRSTIVRWVELWFILCRDRPLINPQGINRVFELFDALAHIQNQLQHGRGWVGFVLDFDTRVVQPHGHDCDVAEKPMHLIICKRCRHGNYTVHAPSQVEIKTHTHKAHNWNLKPLVEIVIMATSGPLNQKTAQPLWDRHGGHVKLKIGPGHPICRPLENHDFDDALSV